MNTIDTQALAETISAAVTTAVIAALNGSEPAAQPKADAPKARSRKVTSKAPTGKAKSEWNRSFAALCKARKGSYREAMDRWTEVQALRDAGKTPRQARKAICGF